MSQSSCVSIFIDGASRGNPGDAAFAFVIQRDGEEAIEASGCIGKATNNAAEYTALIQALQKAVALGVKDVLIHSDSELLVNQMNGGFRVKNPNLRSFYEQACDLRKQFNRVNFVHVPRERNTRADYLCNMALDGQASRRGRPAGLKANPAAPPGKVTREELVRADALDCLQSAKEAWSRRSPAQPSAEDVWDQLWSILQESGLLVRRSS